MLILVVRTCFALICLCGSVLCLLLAYDWVTTIGDISPWWSIVEFVVLALGCAVTWFWWSISRSWWEPRSRILDQKKEE